MEFHPKPATEKTADLGATVANLKAGWLKRGHAFTEFLIGLAALPPMEYDQKSLGISLQRWVPGILNAIDFLLSLQLLLPLQQNLVES
jgi:hypothetical protein